MSEPTPNIEAIQQLLEGYLPHLNKEDGAFVFYELAGFLLVVCSSPETIMPRDWLPVVIGEAMDIPEELGDPNDVLGTIMDLYNWVNGRIIEGESPIPSGLKVHGDAFANFGDEAPIGQWSKGFYEAHDWLNEIWEECLNEELENELSSYMLPLSFFLDENFARAVYEDFARQEKSFRDVAEYMLLLFKPAALDYALLGRSIAETLQELEGVEPVEPVDTVIKPFENDLPKVGRNDLCPCGSGKKYKKCCLH